MFFSPEARNDLHEIGDYITCELENPVAAKNTVDMIINRIHILEQFAQSGCPLSSVLKVETEYRYLVCDNYLAFYRTEAQEESENVYIVRILYGKRDYMKTLFGE